MPHDVNSTPVLDKLSSVLGIWLSFQDPDTGQTFVADTASKRAVCASLGFPAQNEKVALASLKKVTAQKIFEFSPYTMVVRMDEITPLTIELYVPVTLKEKTISFTLTREDSTTQSGVFILSKEQILETLRVKNKTYLRTRVQLNLKAPKGYHTISFLIDGHLIEKTNMQTRLIVVPNRCYQPKSLENGGRVFGVPLQLYALQSQRNWGMGDLTDLKNFMSLAGKWGASYVGINPLNSLFIDAPEEASPYYVSSRLFFNPLYIDTDSVPESVGLPAYDTYKNSTRFKQVVAYCRSSNTVQYAYLSELKMTALGILFEAFKRLHLNSDHTPKTARGEAFFTFCRQKGELLDTFSLWTVLRAVASHENRSVEWKMWEKGFRNPNSVQSKAFYIQYQESILFVKYQQFLAFEQYERALTDDPRAPLIYTDMPVGVGPDSAEVWGDQSLFLPDVSIGAPPDMFNQEGQNWALSAFNPFVLKQRRFEPFIRILREKMRFGGAIRLDHAFGLMRLYLRAGDNTGAYLSYPFSDLIGILALESERNKCLVIAEDLGTPPPSFYDLMRGAGGLSFRLFCYEKNGDRLKTPDQYDRSCLIMTGSHDMPTLSAVWSGADLKLMHRLDLISDERLNSDLNKRAYERKIYLEALSTQGLYVEWEALTRFEETPEWLVTGIYDYLARSNGMIMLMRLEDVLFQEDQVNVPGTYLEYPNWRFKLPVSLEELNTHPTLQHVLSLIHSHRNDFVEREHA